jgi:DNA polymerase V
VQLDFFSDPLEEEKKKEAEAAADAKERKLQLAALALHGKYGKNSLLKAMNLQEGATAMQRNAQIGGHRSGDDGKGGTV